MSPGCTRFDECHIDLVRLARFAGARLIHAEAIGLDRAARQVLCRGRPPVRYDVVSLDIGSTPRLDDVPGAAEHTTPVKPIADFAQRWEALLERAREQGRVRLAIVGGGAGGVELALSAERRLAGLLGAAPEVTLVTREGLLPSHNRRVRALFERLFAERGIRVVADNPVAAGRARPPDRAPTAAAIAFDEALWVTEAAGAPWLADTGLPLDKRGFVVIEEIAAFAGRPGRLRRRRHRDDAGASAREGGRLRGARRTAAGRQSAARARRQGTAARRAAKARAGADRQRRRQGGRVARALRGLWQAAVAAEGLDRPALDAALHRIADHGRGGGRQRRGRDALRRLCRQGTGGSAERERWRGSPRPPRRGWRSGSTAPTTPRSCRSRARRRCCRPSISSGRWWTTRICSAASPPIMRSATSTRWAACRRPPWRSPRCRRRRPAIVEQDLFHMLKGGTEVLEAAGAVLVGGHTAEGAELALGFAVTGRTRARLAAAQGRAAARRPADPDKTARHRRDPRRRDARARRRRASSRARSRRCCSRPRRRRRALAAHGATACTDVTGFGLLGHLVEMLTASGVDARLDPGGDAGARRRAGPARRGADQLAAHRQCRGAGGAGRGRRPRPSVPLLVDPQTAGGLLAGIPAARAAGCLVELRRLGYRAAAIGVVAERAGDRPLVASRPRLPG